MKHFGECSLCLQEKELKNSHILPEFMYQNLYDSDPKRYFIFKANKDGFLKSKPKIKQKGVREHLLCDECELKLSRYENYATETIYGKNFRNKAYQVKAIEYPDMQHFIHVFAGFEYSKFKIFLLSILWRIIISKTFNTPPIEDSIVEKLRYSIFEEKPLEENDFGCLIQLIKFSKEKNADGFILYPYVTINEGNFVLNILIDGLMYSFYINYSGTPAETQMFFLQKDGTMTIIGRLLSNDADLCNRIKIVFNGFNAG